MITRHNCLSCGADLDPTSNEGLCPACMLRSVLTPIPDPDVGVAAPALPRQFGNYELLEEVARGGMGIVYRARQRTLNRTVALKVLLLGANSSETLLARFQMEAEAAASLQHPHIVAIHEFGEFDDQPYYTMDFVAGRDLSQVCEGRPLEPRRAATYLRTIAETVQFAHGRGVLHRDIKPSNVLIDDDDRPRITDFGLAKRLGSESQMTVSGQMVGSPNYIPPEQAQGQEKEIDARTDVYALGGLLYHLMTGRPPFLAGTIPETLRLVVDLADNLLVATLIDPRPVIAIALAPDGRRLASTGFDGILKIWKVDDGTLERAVKISFDPVWAMAFSGDGRWFACGGNDRALMIWDTASWKQLEVLRGHASNLRCVAFSPDGQRVVSGAEDDLAMIWPRQPRRAPAEMPRLLRGPDYFDRTPGLAFSPDSRLFTGTAADGTIKVWRTDTIECVATFPTEARTVAFSSDGMSVLGEGYNGTIHRWNLLGAPAEERIDPTGRFANWQVDPLSSGERVRIVADQVELRARWRLCEIPSTRDGMFAGAMATAQTVAVSPDARSLYIGLPQGKIEVWDLASRQRRLTFPAHKLSVTALAVSLDSRYLASGGSDNSTRLWEAATGQPVATFAGHNRPVWALAFSPDGKTLAAGSCDKQIVLCSIPLRREVASLSLYVGVPKGYEQEVRLLRFSPDGNILAAALGDGTLRFFRAAPFSETDRELR